MRYSSKELQSSGVTMVGEVGKSPAHGKFGGILERRGNEEKGKGEGKKRRKGKRGEEKRVNGEEKRENCKGRGNLFNKMERERYENEKRTLFWRNFFFFFFFFACHFLNPLYQNRNFYGKKLGRGKFSNLAHLWLQTWLRSCSKAYTSWDNY